MTDEERATLIRHRAAMNALSTDRECRAYYRAMPDADREVLLEHGSLLDAWLALNATLEGAWLELLSKLFGERKVD